MSNCRGIVIFALLAFAFTVTGDEGMWTLNNLPAEKLKQQYGFQPDAKWLEHVRMSSARFGNGCSSSFVSPNGLLMTNHHCATSCIEDLSTAENDYLSKGFHAKSLSEEKRCPGLEVQRLEEIEDVTERVRQATGGRKDDEFTTAFNAAKAEISKQCATTEDRHCQVVTLYGGGKYELYKYRRFSDVRLVFAPEKAIAFFGGDPDNFMFPRYNIDVSFLRVYDKGSALKVDHSFKWSRTPPKEGDLTFITGHPGSTERQLTISQLELLRDRTLPDIRIEYAELRGMLTQFQTKGPENRRVSESALLSVENALKALGGEHEALLDRAAFAKKIADEADFRRRVESDPNLEKQYRGAWDAIAAAVEKDRTAYRGYPYIEKGRGFRSRLYSAARSIVRASDELTKSNEKRLPEFADAELPGLKARLFSAAPVSEALEIETLTLSLTKLREVLGPDDPFVRTVLGARSPREIAEEAVKGTKLKDPAARKALFEAGKAAVEKDGDPMIRLARLVDPSARELRTRYEQEVEGVIRKNAELLGRARFAVYGTSEYPDATFTLRLSYGTVKGWVENGKPVSPFTIIGGAFERHTGRDPFRLPDSWLSAKERLNQTTPMNFVTTNDIIGGNSGSPILNKNAEIIGIVFDGNIHSLGGAYWFDETKNRAVSVHGEAILEALRKVYGATALITELVPEPK
jgi:V8-like Glu-specific endopeptidase